MSQYDLFDELFLGKKYELATSENFENFMKAIGVDEQTRAVASALKPTVELTKDADGFYNLVTSSATAAFEPSELKFKPGEEFDERRADGAKLKTVITIDCTKLKQVQKAADGTEVIYEREFSDKEMRAVMIVKAMQITCKRVYKAQ
ncbi:hypothetical protein O0L34_g12073 [Tuta absoluta]|nr:hypothetical protein O0L34_g12073 [Tuta absoluta]